MCHMLHKGIFHFSMLNQATLSRRKGRKSMCLRRLANGPGVDNSRYWQNSLKRECAEGEGIISKHDSTMKSSDYKSDLKTAFSGVFTLPDTVSGVTIQNLATNLHSNQKAELQEPKTDLSGVLCTLHSMLILFKDLASLQDLIGGEEILWRAARQRQVKNNLDMFK